MSLGGSKKSLTQSNIGHLIVKDSPAVAVLDALAEDLPAILQDILLETVTPNALVHGQYLLLQTMISKSLKPYWLIEVATPLAGWSATEEALRISGKTASWFYGKHYIVDPTISKVIAGQVTIRELAEECPEAFFFPLFRGVTPDLS
jgi:hypothetical protein